MTACARDIYINDMPCVCGATLVDHDVEGTGMRARRVCRATACTGFAHAETPPCEPQADSPIGHIYRGWDRNLYRIARLVRFHNTDGLDFEVEPFGDADPNAERPPKRTTVSARAIGGSYHHSRTCPCGGGHWR